MLLDEVDGHGVLGAPRHDHVRVLLGGQAELLEGRLHQGGVLGAQVSPGSQEEDHLSEHVLQVPPTVTDVPHHPPGEGRGDPGHHGWLT